MAKSQKRSNREIRKPKATKPKALSALGDTPVAVLMNKPNAKR